MLFLMLVSALVSPVEGIELYHAQRGERIVQLSGPDAENNWGMLLRKDDRLSLIVSTSNGARLSTIIVPGDVRLSRTIDHSQLVVTTNPEETDYFDEDRNGRSIRSDVDASLRGYRLSYRDLSAVKADVNTAILFLIRNPASDVSDKDKTINNSYECLATVNVSSGKVSELYVIPSVKEPGDQSLRDLSYTLHSLVYFEKESACIVRIRDKIIKVKVVLP